MRAQLVGLGMPIARFEPTYSQFNWWRPNVRGLISFAEAAGFHDVKRKGRLMRPPGKREFRKIALDKGVSADALQVRGGFENGCDR